MVSAGDLFYHSSNRSHRRIHNALVGFGFFIIKTVFIPLIKITFKNRQKIHNNNPEKQTRDQYLQTLQGQRGFYSTSSWKGRNQMAEQAKFITWGGGGMQQRQLHALGAWDLTPNWKPSTPTPINCKWKEEERYREDSTWDFSPSCGRNRNAWVGGSLKGNTVLYKAYWKGGDEQG